MCCTLECLDLLAAGLLPGEDGQEEGGGLVGLVGARHDDVFSGLQREELHHFTGIHQQLGLGNGSVAAEERCRELSGAFLILQENEHASLFLERVLGAVTQNTYLLFLTPGGKSVENCPCWRQKKVKN